MKNYKAYLLASAMTSALLPASLEAVTLDDLEATIRASRSCSVVVEKEKPEPKGWFSSFRNAAGDALRAFGHGLRTQNHQTSAGILKEQVKDVAASLLFQRRLAFSVTSSIFNPLGNFARAVGQVVKGGQATQSQKRSTVDLLAKEADVAYALKLAATANLNVDAATAFDNYKDVVEGLNNRGRSTHRLDVNKIYMDALAANVFRNKPGATSEDFSRELRARGFRVMEQMKPVQETSSPRTKLNLMEQYLKNSFDNEKAKYQFDTSRSKVL